jgi:hypothetical protein
VAGSGGVDSMLLFWLERGGDRTKCCRKMKRRKQARLGSMRRKRYTARGRGDIGQRRGTPGRGNGGDNTSWADTNLTELKK